ncbi:hypothetical protein [Pseudobacteroides cellulosolvens]|uniref:Uncharacterized protein n=1 Tax=Pseudobacteroides cellulosolvens ATCC 35603 = DSM 2933 TaxID=398512 RepID=A0A0L6JGM8_9FIRM|nr:hypothetical protein [Pseudobacteroides cellulosolvens]KNY24850.1 hypothetical protein Bccel_0107 [Pseudobacteroides cellulosolvens ATCC 35603 = DSM 2933]
MIDKVGWDGTWYITTKNKITGAITEEKIKNRIMNAALNAFADCLLGITPNYEIKYMAVGTSSAPITDTDTKLGSEIFRVQPVAAPTRTNTGEITTEFQILDSEAVATIEEIGIFCGSTATSSADTGNLLSRILWHKVKSSSEELTFKRVDKIQRG